MPTSPRDSRYSRRDDDGARHRPDRHDAGSRARDERRSRSPHRSRRHSPDERQRRTQGGTGERHSSKRHRSPHRRRQSPGRPSKVPAQADVELPYSARPLHKADLNAFKPLFADYLSLQKQKELADMDDRETRGRWKSFVGKWNRGELAEGWYDPEMFERILAREPAPEVRDEAGPSSMADQVMHTSSNNGNSDDEDYGPILPGTGTSRQTGVSIPTLQDLSLRRELAEESREADRGALRAARKADRAEQKERLDDLVPRAEAGTRERKLEKRQEVNEKMRAFRDKSPGMEVGEKDLMGGGDSIAEYKNAKEKEQRRKSEREIRREELWRAKQEEMEEKRRAWQQREEGTVNMLRELAKQRFG